MNSPGIFNTLYAQILKKHAILAYPTDSRDFDLNAVYYLVFADDLVLVSANLRNLELAIAELDLALAWVGMKINGGKTQWMSYLPRTCDSNFDLPLTLSIFYQGCRIENVDDFKYLGFTTTADLSHKAHRSRRISLMNLAAKLTGRLLRSLETTNMRSLRAYFYALVNCQLYSLCVNTFDEECHDRAIKIFLQECFNLPNSYPMIMAKFFVGVEDLWMQIFNARSGFINRLLRGLNTDASLSAMVIDRDVLLQRGIGWNMAFFSYLETAIDLSQIDLTDPTQIAETREELSRALRTRRRVRFSNSSLSFIVDLFPSLTPPPAFLEHIQVLPFESVRIILIFMANLMQYTYFRSDTLSCPFCTLTLSSTHLFQCQRIQQDTVGDWSSFVRDCVQERFREAIDRLFLVFQRWTVLTDRFQPSFLAHIDEYFEATEYRSQRVTNPGLCALT
jgi:hypothetical protein